MHPNNLFHKQKKNTPLIFANNFGKDNDKVVYLVSQ